MELTERPPKPRQQLVDPLYRVIGDMGDDVGEIGLGIEDLLAERGIEGGTQGFTADAPFAGQSENIISRRQPGSRPGGGAASSRAGSGRPAPRDRGDDIERARIYAKGGRCKGRTQASGIRERIGN